MLRPKITVAGSVPRRSPSAARASCTICSARCSAAVTVPRLAIELVSVAATASATTAGVWEPPGPSKWAVPVPSAGNWARTAATSRAGGGDCFVMTGD